MLTNRTLEDPAFRDYHAVVIAQWNNLRIRGVFADPSKYNLVISEDLYTPSDSERRYLVSLGDGLFLFPPLNKTEAQFFFQKWTSKPLYNSNFEWGSLRTWSHQGNATLSIEQEMVIEGNFSMKIEGRGDCYIFHVKKLDCLPGYHLLYEGYLMANPNSNIQLCLFLYNKEGRFLGSVPVGQPVRSEEWVWVSETVTVPENVYGIRAAIHYNSEAESSAYVDALSVTFCDTPDK